MKETIVNPLEKALTDILTKATAGVEKGIDFLNAELPKVVEQLLLWKMWESLLYCIFSVGLIIVLCFIPFAIYKNLKKFKFLEWDFEIQIVVSTIGGTCGFIGLIFACIKAFSMFNVVWLQIWLAPKIYLIEYAASLLK
jgi:hypothetical protein